MVAPTDAGPVRSPQPAPSQLGWSGQQSPIRLGPGDAVPDRLPALRFDYPTSTSVRLRYLRQDAAAPRGRSEDIVLAEVTRGTGVLWVGEDRYKLEQFHWHTPSEHVVNGRRSPVEQHLVHRGADGRLLVVGVLVGDEVPARELGRLLAAAPSDGAAPTTVRGVDLTALLPASTASYRYEGSLTTSPYAEGVSWIVLAEPLHASTADLAPLRAIFPNGNSRALQPLNGRTIRTDLTTPTP